MEHARVSVSGGKRFRAAFCWWGHLAVAEPEDRDGLLKACASLELLHASALVHDDVMDASDVRRGRPATHRAFEALHRERQWAASPEQYGAAAAILLGDLLLSWSDELLRTCGLPSVHAVGGNQVAAFAGTIDAGPAPASQQIFELLGRHRRAENEALRAGAVA